MNILLKYYIQIKQKNTENIFFLLAGKADPGIFSVRKLIQHDNEDNGAYPFV